MRTPFSDTIYVLCLYCFYRLYEFLGYFGGVPDGSILLGYDAVLVFTLIPTVQINIIYEFTTISTIENENNTLPQNLSTYLHTDSVSSISRTESHMGHY
jgi:hypothetical protein